jgi:type IV secretory pathway TrbD component
LLERLPDRFLNARTARAITAPSAIVLGGAGAAIAIVAGLPVAAVVGAGALAWAARVAIGLPRRARGDRIDPFVLSEPWRRFVNEALQAERRFDRAVAKADTGPLRDRLAEIGARIDTGVRECWRVAQRADAIQDGMRTLDIESTKRELVDVERDLSRATDPRLERAREALRAQLRAAQRMIDAVEDAHSQLRLLDARLDEAVTRAIELSLRSAGDADVAGLGSDVELLVSDMEALRAALEDVDATGGTTATA